MLPTSAALPRRCAARAGPTRCLVMARPWRSSCPSDGCPDDAPGGLAPRGTAPTDPRPVALDLEGPQRHPLLLRVQLDQAHAAGGDARHERLAGGDGLVRARRRVDDPVIGAGLVDGPPWDVGRSGAHGVAGPHGAHG